MALIFTSLALSALIAKEPSRFIFIVFLLSFVVYVVFLFYVKYDVCVVLLVRVTLRTFCRLVTFHIDYV